MITKTPGAFVDIDGVPIWYQVAGRGPVLIVQCPGWGIGSQIYATTLAYLAASFTMVFYDTRGSGRSRSDCLHESSVNVGTLVDDLEALRHFLGLERFALLGHSHGGYIALNYALKFPGHLDALILVDAQLGVNEPLEDLRRTLPVLARQSALADAVAAWTGPRSLESDQDLTAFVRTVSPLYFKDPHGPAWREFAAMLDFPVSLKAFMATSATNRHFEVRALLASICTPTLCMVGEHDFICSPMQSEAIVNAVAGARLARFANSGHFCWIEEPSAFRAVLTKFLNKAIVSRP